MNLVIIFLKKLEYFSNSIKKKYIFKNRSKYEKCFNYANLYNILEI